MDDGHFDLVTRALHNSRRTLLGGLVGLTALGLTEAGDAKKKKKGKKKKKKGSPGNSGNRCVFPMNRCSSDSQCCPSQYNTSPGVCRVPIGWDTGVKQCCIPSHEPAVNGNTNMCCGHFSEQVEDGGFRCCIYAGHPDEGHPEHCCEAFPSIDGVCCLPRGFSCEVNGKKLPCCSGTCGPDGDCT
jgi:hypothetical protein